ncbi:MAG TPA: HipA family kinase [Longimicrobiales bacterium]
MLLPHHQALRYVQPLREGGSLPAIVDTDNGLFVVKFRGAGQGPKALIAEIIVGSLAQRLGLPVPELVTVEIDESFGRTEPDPEIQEILRASHGINVGMRYLDGAFNFDGFAAGDFIDAELASAIVWFDAYTTNPDRTHRNPNILICNRKPWLIDHGAAIYAHHAWSAVDAERTATTFPLIKDHVLLPPATHIAEAGERLRNQITEGILQEVLGLVPDALLRDPVIAAEFDDAAAARRRYHNYFMQRLSASDRYTREAISAREIRLTAPLQRRKARR